ncbi:uncharacterized protein LOC121857522 [Homarus americanus]|uniref:uncharacterized protein LOC121857522 n=1 Tax=Homarus americanus TaxID=6706 RepID=UPI001C488799|nr:uncharacterized protein LOC121857522 [Homarus americanus]
MEIRKNRLGLRRLSLRVFVICSVLLMSCVILSQRGNESTQMTMNEARWRVKGPLSLNDSRVLSILRQYHLSPPSIYPYNLSTDPLYTKMRYYGGWKFIYNQIEQIFGDYHGGFFVEAGALDGEKLSNTLWLEQKLNWTGLLIEPSPENYAKLVNKRRKAWISHTCLSTAKYPEEQVMVTLLRRYLNEDQVTRVVNDHRGSSYLLGTSLETNIYDKLFQNSDKSYSLVQCFPLASYLMALNITTVDFLSLDIQGAEKDVLRYIPWDSVNIRVMVIEVVHYETMDRHFVDVITSKGYELIYFRSEDYIFIRKGDPLILKHNISMIYV